jgi:hypothetical protein
MDLGQEAVLPQSDDNEVDFVFDLRRKLFVLDRGYAAISKTTMRHDSMSRSNRAAPPTSVGSFIRRRRRR